MEFIDFLVFILKVSGLLFVIGVLFNLILDSVIITPIINRSMEAKKLKIMDVLINKLENGEDIYNMEIDGNIIKAETEEKIED